MLVTVLSFLDLQPTNFAYYGNRCACYIMTKDYQSALNDARKSTAYNSNFTKGYLREAKCHMTLGSAPFAKRCLLKALEIDPSNQQAKTDVSFTFKQIKIYIIISKLHSDQCFIDSNLL